MGGEWEGRGGREKGRDRDRKGNQIKCFSTVDEPDTQVLCLWAVRANANFLGSSQRYQRTRIIEQDEGVINLSDGQGDMMKKRRNHVIRRGRRDRNGRNKTPQARTSVNKH